MPRHSMLPRFLPKLVVAFVMGSVLNLVVAWLAAYRADWTNAFSYRHNWGQPATAEVRDQGSGLGVNYNVEWRAAFGAAVRDTTIELWEFRSFVVRVTPEYEPLDYDFFSNQADPGARWAWSVRGPYSWGVPARHDELVALLPSVGKVERIETAAGFPALAFCSESDRADWFTPMMPHRWGLALPAHKHPRTIQGAGLPFRVLPYKPIWSGLLLNTLVYVLLWLGFSHLMRGTLRARRRHRGRCPRCAHDLAHDYRAGCPECGWRREPMTPKPA